MYSKRGFVKKKNSSNTKLLNRVIWTWPLYRHAPKANSTIEFRGKREREEEEEVKRIKKNPLHFGKEPLKLLPPKLRTSKLLRLAKFAAIWI